MSSLPDLLLKQEQDLLTFRSCPTMVQPPAWHAATAVGEAEYSPATTFEQPSVFYPVYPDLQL